jgi:hypothetical protein
MAIVSIAIVSRRYALEVEAGELLPLGQDEYRVRTVHSHVPRGWQGKG